MNLSILARCGLFRGIETAELSPLLRVCTPARVNLTNFSRFTVSAIPRMRYVFCSRAA